MVAHRSDRRKAGTDRVRFRFHWSGFYTRDMNGLLALDDCLQRALAALEPVAPVLQPCDEAIGAVLADDLLLPCDFPVRDEALQAGLAVNSLDLVGAGADNPVPLTLARSVEPGQALPANTDAVLGDDGFDRSFGQTEALRAVHPGEGLRRAGHDGRSGDLLAPAGTRVSPRLALAATLAGYEQLPVRRPQVALQLPHLPHNRLVAAWLQRTGATTTTAPADLIICPTRSHRPGLALMPAETAWLETTASGLLLSVPRRFDGLVCALLALALPLLGRCSGAQPQQKTRPLARKVSSALGLTELVLLHTDGGDWAPSPPGTITLTGLAGACAFALIPADSEGLAAGTTLTATAIDQPFG